MHMDLFYKIIFILVPLIFIIELIVKYRKGQYNPNLFEYNQPGYLKRIIFSVAFMFSADQISDKFFLKIVSMTILLVFPVVISILNFIIMSIKSDKSILFETIIIDFFFLMILIGALAVEH